MMRSSQAADGGRRRFLAVASAFAAIPGILRTGASSAAPTAPAAPAVHTVVIDGFAFKPAVLTVDRGDTVVWRNDDPVPHTATAKGVFDSGSIPAGGTWKFVVARSGRFDYLCTFHTIMKGTLVVR